MTGNSMIDNVFLVISLLACLFAGYVFYDSVIAYERPLPSEEIEKQALLEDTQQANFVDSYRLDKLIINLPGRSRRLRFLEITIHFVPFKDKDVGTLEDKKHILQNSIIEIAGQMTPDKLNSVTGKLLLEERIKTGCNKELGRDVIKEMFFSRFVVQ
jgi:flagellar FliL protein